MSYMTHLLDIRASPMDGPCGREDLKPSDERGILNSNKQTLSNITKGDLLVRPSPRGSIALNPFLIQSTHPYFPIFFELSIQLNSEKIHEP